MANYIPGAGLLKQAGNWIKNTAAPAVVGAAKAVKNEAGQLFSGGGLLGAAGYNPSSGTPLQTENGEQMAGGQPVLSGGLKINTPTAPTSPIAPKTTPDAGTVSKPNVRSAKSPAASGSLKIATVPPATPKADPATAQLQQEAANMAKYGSATAPTTPTTPPPVTPPPSPPAPTTDTPPASPYNDAVTAYLNLLNTQAGTTSDTQTKINDLEAKIASLNAGAGLGKVAVGEQPIEMGFQTGQKAAIDRRLAAETGALAAQEVPLKDQLAIEQAKNTAALDAAKAKVDLTKPTAVTAGQDYVDPTTGKVLYSGAQKPVTLAQGSTLVNPNTGETIATGAPKTTSDMENYNAAVAQGYTGTLVDWMTAKKGAGAAASLSPEDTTFMAQQYLTTGVLPSMGYGAAGAAMKAQIITEAAKMAREQGMTGTDIALNKAAYTANSNAIKQLTTQSNATARAEKAASTNLDYALKLSSSVPRTGSPLVNRYVQWAQNAAGVPQLTAFETAIYTAAREYAKVTSGGAQSAAGLTDSANAEAQKLLNAAMNPDQLAAAIATMKVDMENVNGSFRDQIQSAKDDLSSLGSVAGGTSGGSSSTTNSNDAAFDF